MKNTETEINFALMGAQFQPLSGQRLLNQRVRDQLGECTLGPKRSGTVSERYALSSTTSKKEKKGKFIEWILSCAGRDVLGAAGSRSVKHYGLPRLLSHALNPALVRRTLKSDL